LIDTLEIRSPLPRAVDEAIGFVRKHDLHGIKISGVRHTDTWTLPPAAVREAIINAVVHTDYSQRGAPIRAAFFDDRLEIENPGLLPFGLTIQDMRDGVSRLRTDHCGNSNTYRPDATGRPDASVGASQARTHPGSGIELTGPEAAILPAGRLAIDRCLKSAVTAATRRFRWKRRHTLVCMTEVEIERVARPAVKCHRQAMTASMRTGPRSNMAIAKALSNSSAVSQRTAETPMLRANGTQSMEG
jgi:hypothetical protein